MQTLATSNSSNVNLCMGNVCTSASAYLKIFWAANPNSPINTFLWWEWKSELILFPLAPAAPESERVRAQERSKVVKAKIWEGERRWGKVNGGERRWGKVMWGSKQDANKSRTSEKLIHNVRNSYCWTNWAEFWWSCSVSLHLLIFSALFCTNKFGNQQIELCWGLY